MGSGEGVANRGWLFSKDLCSGGQALGWDVCFCEQEQWTMAGGLGSSSAAAFIGNSSANASVKLPATENEVINKTPKSTVQPGLKLVGCVNKAGKFKEDVSR